MILTFIEKNQITITITMIMSRPELESLCYKPLQSKII